MILSLSLFETDMRLYLKSRAINDNSPFSGHETGVRLMACYGKFLIIDQFVSGWRLAFLAIFRRIPSPSKSRIETMMRIQIKTVANLSHW